MLRVPTAALILSALFAASALQADGLPQGPYVSTSADAVVAVPPDFAMILISGSVAAATSADARASILDLQRRIRSLLEDFEGDVAPVELDVAESDFVQKWNRSLDRYERLGFKEAFEAHLRVDGLDRVDELFHELSLIDDLQVMSPEFGVDDPASARAEARRRALEKARTTAEQLAHSQGARLGAIWGVVHRSRHDRADPVRWADSVGAPRRAGDPADLGQVEVTGSNFDPVLPFAVRAVEFSAEVGVVYELLSVGSVEP